MVYLFPPSSVCIVMIKRFRFYTLEKIGPQRFLFCILRLLLYGKKGCVNIKLQTEYFRILFCK